jgi:Protein of unknown function (DUF4031)
MGTPEVDVSPRPRRARRKPVSPTYHVANDVRAHRGFRTCRLHDEAGVTVYVDHAFAFGDWGRWSGGGHLQADTPAELHAFAERLGMRREWFQSRAGRPENDHYDLTRAGRERALQLGAVAEDQRAGARRRRSARTAARPA